MPTQKNEPIKPVNIETRAKRTLNTAKTNRAVHLFILTNTLVSPSKNFFIEFIDELLLIFKLKSIILEKIRVDFYFFYLYP